MYSTHWGVTCIPCLLKVTMKVIRYLYQYSEYNCEYNYKKLFWCNPKVCMCIHLTRSKLHVHVHCIWVHLALGAHLAHCSGGITKAADTIICGYLQPPGPLVGGNFYGRCYQLWCHRARQHYDIIRLHTCS